MIHRDSRNRLAEALRQYVSGRITNDDLDAIAVDRRDQGAVAVKQQAWFMYSDLKKHYVEGTFPPRSEERRAVVLWIAFLHSDEEYFWPEQFIQISSLFMNILTLGWWGKKKREEFDEAGDISVWPFSSRSQLERVAKQPRLLTGLQHKV